MRPLTAIAIIGLGLAASIDVSAATDAALSPPKGAEPTFWAQVITWVVEEQRAFHRELTVALKALTADGGLEAAWGLVLASFLYGIFHAAGPGHGKAVLTTYLLTHRQHFTRGISLAAAAALCQGLVAVILVYGLIYAAGWLPRETSAAVTWSERTSYLLVAAIGLLLLTRAARGGYVLVRSKPATRTDAPGGPDRGSEHEHEEHTHHAEHHACGCGHSHAPTAAQMDGSGDLRSMVGIVLSIGLRPCSGAVLVLVFAKALGLAWAGVGAVFAMSVGTAIAVAALAFLTVNARNWATSLVAHRGMGWMVAGSAVAFVGGAVILALGISLLVTSLAPAHPLGL